MAGSSIVDGMTKSVHETIKLNAPCDILAAVPHLLGFSPTDSLVLITVHDLEQHPRFGLTLRIDLPKPDARYQLAEYLLGGPLGNHGAEALMVVVVGQRIEARREPEQAESRPPDGSSGEGESPPHAGLITVLREVLGTAGISMLHATWASEIRSGGAWQCYEQDHCRGEIADPGASAVGAAMAAAGAVTFESRQDLKALVAPEPDENLAQRAARLDALSEDLEHEQGSTSGARRDLEVVFAAVARTAEGIALTEDDHLRVLIALSDSRVRDLALSTALGESARAAEQLWLTLVRKAPAPEIADVAALLAFSTYLRGEGALAGAALERIEEARPDHRLGALLRQALDSGITPEDLTIVARDAAEDARILIEEDGAW